MSKGKLQKFADMENYPHVFQYPYAVAEDHPFEMRGRWNEVFFHNDHPIILELGCGRAEYTLGLARLNPMCNYIAVDIKGARMWAGAKQSLQEGLPNVAFLRTNIEIIDRFFAPSEVSEIWLTFPDPQMKKRTKRMTSTGFLAQYAKFLKEGGIINLKTDSNFMYTYTKELVKANSLDVIMDTDDLHNNPVKDDEVNKWLTEITTYYEKQWIARGKSIKYISFRLDKKPLQEPEVEIELDDYRSFGREKRSALNLSK